MIFRDRIEAGELLAEALAHWRGQNPLIAAIPRGAVPMGKVIADRLGGDLDVVLTRKLRTPGNPEFAIGAVDETGWTYLTEYAEQTGAARDYMVKAGKATIDGVDIADRARASEIAKKIVEFRATKSVDAIRKAIANKGKTTTTQ